MEASVLTLSVSGPMADVVSKRKGTVTYLQVLEMHGRLGPQQPRQRVLINLTAIRTDNMAALMGLDLSMVRFSERMSEHWFRQRLGLSVHIAIVGLVLMAALAPPLKTCLGEAAVNARPLASPRRRRTRLH